MYNEFGEMVRSDEQAKQDRAYEDAQFAQQLIGLDIELDLERSADAAFEEHLHACHANGVDPYEWEYDVQSAWWE